MASIRASASRADRYRAAPAVLTSSRPASTAGTAIAATVATTPTVTASSVSEYPDAAFVLATADLFAGRVPFGPGSADRDLRLQLEEVLLADTAHIHQLLDLLERSVLLPVLDDARRSLGANTWQRLEIGCRRCVEVDDSRRRLGGGVCGLRCLSKPGSRGNHTEGHEDGDGQSVTEHFDPPLMGPWPARLVVREVRPARLSPLNTGQGRVVRRQGPHRNARSARVAGTSCEESGYPRGRSAVTASARAAAHGRRRQLLTTPRLTRQVLGTR